MINCVVVDDEPLAQEGMANYVREVDFLNLVGVCENPVQIMAMLDQI
jgi:two-component system LytT family response regulator